MTTQTLLALADRLDHVSHLLNECRLTETSLLDGVIAELRALAAPQVEMVSELPELPEPQKECWIGHDLYSADQMRAYAQAALNARAGGDGYAPVFAELERAVQKFPTWPTDPLHAAGVLNEEVGELNKAILQAVYEPHKSGPKEVREEAIQVTAMALRFFLSLDRYEYTKGEQHQQGEA